MFLIGLHNTLESPQRTFFGKYVLSVITVSTYLFRHTTPTVSISTPITKAMPITMATKTPVWENKMSLYKIET